MFQHQWTQSGFLAVSTVLSVILGVDGFLDFTCLAPQARTDINGDNDMFIGGYNGRSYDEDTSVSFGRISNTGTSSGLILPTGSGEKYHDGYPEISARILTMPQSGGVERIGAFYCNANKDGVDEQNTIIIMASASTITPREFSQTVSVGQQVTFDVDTDVDVTTLRWRHNGGAVISSLNYQTTYTIGSVTTEDAGVYECYQNGERSKGVHAIFQLIVRSCQHGKWSPPNCNRDCPHCFNEGVCDERSGECVCAPGFSGQYCRTVHGRNKLGQDGTLQCSGPSDHGYGCQSILFCLPHPYGCSCAAGFKGIDCDQECEDQMYGTNCRQQCHCATGNCLKDTGECDSGQCEADWYGVNCQEYCPALDPEPVTNLHVVFASDDSISVEWDHYDQCPGFTQYVVEYELINQDNCLLLNQVVATVMVTTKEHSISGLNFFSAYKVGVKVFRQFSQSVTFQSVSDSVVQITDEAVPSGPPQNITAINITSSTMTFEWMEPRCGDRRGEIVSYEYTFKNDNNRELAKENIVATQVRFDGLEPLKAFTFSISALTAKGAGPQEDLVVTTPPATPTDLSFTDISKYAMTMTWKEPTNSGDLITGYSVLYFVAAKPYDPSFLHNLPFVGQHFVMKSESLSYRITGLLPSTAYQVRVAAHSNFGQGDEAVGMHFTQPADKEDMPHSDYPIGKVTSSTVMIEIPETESAFVTGYQIGIELHSQFTCDRQLSGSMDFDHYFCNAQSYIAAELLKEDVLRNPEFIIGDNNTYGSYYNPPLKNQEKYLVYIGLISRINESIYGVSWSVGQDIITLESPSEGSYSYFYELIIVSVFLCLLLISVFIAGCKIRKLKATVKALQSEISPNNRNFCSSDQVAMSNNGFDIEVVDQKKERERTQAPHEYDSEYAYAE